MAASPSEPPLLSQVRKLLAAGTLAERPDRELVERFAQGRDDQAFEALVRRHGPMVFRVCQRVFGRVRARSSRAKGSRSGTEALFRDWPMAVLVNAEIPGTAAQAGAAALQDAVRATLVGERTGTEGYVNSVLPLSEGGFSLTLRT